MISSEGGTIETQLRIYRLKPGTLAQWLEEWRQQICPLRLRFGFRLLGAWAIDESDTFVWLLAYDGRDGFEAADAAYYASPERAAIEPDPARYLAATEEWMLRPVGPG